jgi:nodulation protein E
LGAAGAVELVVTLKALSEQQVPPTINWLETDPNCDLDAVPNNSRPHRIVAAMSNSFAFGGINTSLVVRHPADLS